MSRVFEVDGRLSIEFTFNPRDLEIDCGQTVLEHALSGYYNRHLEDVAGLFERAVDLSFRGHNELEPVSLNLDILRGILAQFIQERLIFPLKGEEKFEQ